MDSVRASVQRAMTLQLRIGECHRILEYAHQYAEQRWLNDKKSFMDIANLTGKPHIVNTSTALTVISRFPAVFGREHLEAYNGVGLAEVCRFYVERYEEKGFWQSKETPSWSPYVTSLALRALGYCVKLNAGRTTMSEVVKTEKALPEILRNELHRIQDYLLRWADQDLGDELGDYDHTFFAYTALEAYQVIAAELKGSPIEFIKPEDSARESTVIQKVLNRLRLDFYSHMTFKLSGVSQHLDTVSLALSMYCMAEHSNERYQIPDDVLDAALNTVFSLQLPSGFWDTSTPLLGAATGRVGCSSIELASCLIRIPRTRKNFGQYFENFDRLLAQLSRGFDSRHPERGWPTDLRRDGSSYQTWYSFLVFEYLSLMAQTTSEYAAELLLQDFRYRKSKPKFVWDQLGDYASFKDRIKTAFIDSRQNGTGSPEHSMILFGPPGTGKTSIAQALAYELNWGFVEIGPGDFLENGIDGIFAQGDLIFQRLLLLDRVVVLFDEIDELVSVRHDETDKLSKFLTTYMLPWLQRLRDKASVIFIFATNHISRFDPAIRRHGRFDLIVPIGPPQSDEREKILKAMKGKLGVEDKDIMGVLKDIPAQATIGDIASAVSRAKSAKGFDPTLFRAQMSPEKLLIGEEEWNGFLQEVDRY